MVYLFLFLLLCLVFFTEELYRYVFLKNSSRLFEKLFDFNGHDDGYYIQKNRKIEILKQEPCQEYTLVNSRNQRLKGYYYSCGGNKKRIVFLIHGYRSDHLDAGSMYYEYYKSRNIDFFCVDHTASGKSEGNFIGFDVLEAPDCLEWIAFLKKQFGDDIQIILHGFSMGGATVLQMSGHCPSQVRFIVADSAYTCAKAAMFHQIGPFYSPLRLINRIAAGYDWNDSDVRSSLSVSNLPILFVHGKDDTLVPASCGPELFKSYHGPKDNLFMEHTRHVETMYTSPEAYCEKLDQFISRYLD